MMTPTQQAAIEGLAGRPLTSEEVALANARRDVDLAISISVGRTKMVETRETERSIIAALGAVDGEAFLEALYTFSTSTLPANHPLEGAQKGIARSLSWLKPEKGGINISDPQTTAMLDLLAANGYVNASHIAALKALGVVPAPVDFNDLSKILNG